MRTTKIEWTEKTWNPVTGCTKFSEGCVNCYAEVMSKRLQAMGQIKYKSGFKVTIHPECLDQPLTWKKSATIFVCSMSDLFHESISFEFIDKVLDIIKQTPQHKYQILTKRAERMALYFNGKDIPSNIWLGVTVESADYKNRIDYIRNLNVRVKFLSCEPLLGDLGQINLVGINWVIVGGESGNRARPMKEKWLLSIKEQADKVKIPFFFKQWGTWGQDGVKRNKTSNGKLIRGKTYQEIPL
ncbi:phage Gp37/Gp68 family protein [uncultured Bacteroides sp.]|uniref:phage Gp37/Gp68 family protein n=1 Tax=uncultured Bacteroides sp. TaxID=162156 RepID=UPI002AA6275D|nr:phage Gp37/Gp68 family protein [uncultured Bacteroides sp.]